MELSDEFDDLLLAFEVPDVLLTATQLATLQTLLGELRAEVDLANERIDDSNIPKLRDRIKALEADNKTLKAQVSAAQRAPKPTPRPGSSSSAFNKSERVLLEGIPERIVSRCVPARGELGYGGTVASVSCTPNTTAVSGVQYFLMEGADAADHFNSIMNVIYSVPESTGPSDTCRQGRRAQRTFVGNGWQSEGCDREPGPLTFVFFVDNATNCRQLKVGGRQLKSPAYLIQLRGDHNDIARTYRWATKSVPGGQIQSIAGHIPRPNAKLSPSCPT